MRARGSVPARRESFAGERVPTLDEILPFAKEHDVIFYLEIKSGAAWGVEHAVVAALRDSGEVRARRDSFVRSCHARFRPPARQHDDDRILCASIPRTIWWSAPFGPEPGNLSPRGDLITPALVEKAHRAGLQVVAWTINEPEQMRRLIAAGVDGIMTDYPDRLVSVLREM